MRRQSCTHTLLTALTLVTLALVSKQSLATLAQPWDTNPSVWVAQTATAAGRVRVTITKTRLKFYLAKSQRIVARLDDQDDDYYDDLPELQVGYRRPELVNQSVDLELSDDIKIRLALARLKAIKRHQETWS